MKQVAAIYSRVSTEYQSEGGHSMEAQRGYVEEFARFKGYTDLVHYSDPAFSGRRFDNRPEFLRMISDIDDGKISAVIVYSLSRFGRNTADTIKWVNHLHSKKVAFYIVDLNIDTTTTHGNLIFQIMSSLAEFESNQTSDRIKSVMNFRKKSHKVYSANTPFGFETKGDKLVPSPGEMRMVKTIFNLRKEGKTLQEICDYVNGKGFRGRKGKEFQRNSIKFILENEIYKEYIDERNSELNG